jgi:hypothetical protein
MTRALTRYLFGKVLFSNISAIVLSGWSIGSLNVVCRCVATATFEGPDDPATWGPAGETAPAFDVTRWCDAACGVGLPWSAPDGMRSEGRIY